LREFAKPAIVGLPCAQANALIFNLGKGL
jgi:hypothetical protein